MRRKQQQWSCRSSSSRSSSPLCSPQRTWPHQLLSSRQKGEQRTPQAPPINTVSTRPPRASLKPPPQRPPALPASPLTAAPRTMPAPAIPPAQSWNRCVHSFLLSVWLISSKHASSRFDACRDSVRTCGETPESMCTELSVGLPSKMAVHAHAEARA